MTATTRRLRSIIAPTAAQLIARLSLLFLSFALTVLPGCDKPTSNQPAPAKSATNPTASTTPRLVVLSPALAVILRDLHCERSIVGRHGWDMVLDKSLPVCGDQAGIDYEALINARPTHVLLEWGQRDLPERLMQLAKQRGWHISNYQMLTLDEIRDTTHRLYDDFVLGNALDKPADSKVSGIPIVWSMSQIATDMSRAWSKRTGPDDATLQRAGRVAVLESVNPAHVLGPGSFHYQILTAIGATPVPEKGGPYIEMDAEDILHLAPDVIILIEPRNPEAPARAKPFSWEEISTKLGPLAKLNIPSITNRHVAIIDDPLALTPSTAMIGLADELARLLTTWSESPKPAQ